MLLSKKFWKPVLWWNVKTSNIEYYDIQYAAERTIIHFIRESYCQNYREKCQNNSHSFICDLNEEVVKLLENFKSQWSLHVEPRLFECEKRDFCAPGFIWILLFMVPIILPLLPFIIGGGLLYGFLVAGEQNETERFVDFCKNF